MWTDPSEEYSWLIGSGQGVNSVEVDRNQNFLAGTRNQPGIRFPLLVPGFEIFDLPGQTKKCRPYYWSDQEVPGLTKKFLVWPRCSWLEI